MPKTVEVFGQTWNLNDSISEFDMMEFAAADVEDGRETMAAQFRLLKACIIDDEWARFRAAASKHRVGSEDLLPVFTAMSAQLTERPTGLPADSSDGQQPTELKSVPNSEGRASGRFAGRPDLQAAIERTKAS